jgi:hypothetical protein
MATGAAAVAIGGSIIQANAQQEQAELQAKDAQSRADNLRLQANEVSARFELFTRPDIERRKNIVTAQQVSALAKSGVDVSSGTSLSVVQETAKLAAEELIRRRRENLFQTEALHSEAKNFEDQIAGIKSAGKYAAAGTLLSGFGAAGSSLGFFKQTGTVTKPGTGNKAADPTGYLTSPNSQLA